MTYIPWYTGIKLVKLRMINYKDNQDKSEGVDSV